MEWPLYIPDGTQVGVVQVPEHLLSVPVRVDILYEVVRWQMWNARSFTASTRSWSLVRGGGRKPWRQKGTGRARQGSIRSPLWKGGAKVHGPKPGERVLSLPKKVRKLALRMALSDRTSAGVIRVVQNLSLEKPSTKFAEGIVKKITPGKTLVVLGDGRTTPGVPTPLEKCFRNLPYVKALQVEGLNVKDILWSDYLLVDERALPKIWQRLEFPVRRRVNGE